MRRRASYGLEGSLSWFVLFRPGGDKVVELIAGECLRLVAVNRWGVGRVVRHPFLLLCTTCRWQNSEAPICWTSAGRQDHNAAKPGVAPDGHACYGEGSLVPAPRRVRCLARVGAARRFIPTEPLDYTTAYLTGQGGKLSSSSPIRGQALGVGGWLAGSGPAGREKARIRQMCEGRRT